MLTFPYFYAAWLTLCCRATIPAYIILIHWFLLYCVHCILNVIHWKGSVSRAHYGWGVAIYKVQIPNSFQTVYKCEMLVNWS